MSNSELLLRDIKAFLEATGTSKTALNRAARNMRLLERLSAPPAPGRRTPLVWPETERRVRDYMAAVYADLSRRRA
jgi:hypothetical protein